MGVTSIEAEEAVASSLFADLLNNNKIKLVLITLSQPAIRTFSVAI